MVSHYHCQSSFLNSVVHSLPKCLLATIWMWIIPLLLWILYKILWAFSMPIQMKIPQHQSFLLHWLVRITTNGLKRCSKRWLQRTRRNLLMEASENLIGVIRLTKHGKDATTVWYFPGLWSLMLGGTCEKDSDSRKAWLTLNFPLMLGGIFEKKILTSRSGKNFQNSGRLIFLQTEFTFCHSIC